MKKMMMMMTRENMIVSILKLFVIALMTAKTVMSASSVIPVNVTMDSITYHPHQYMNINIKFDTSNYTTGSVSSSGVDLIHHITFTFVKANTTKRDVVTDRTNKVLDVTVQMFDIRSLVLGTGQFVIRNPFVVRGFYKVFVSITSTTGEYNAPLFASGIHLSSKAYRVLPLLLKMETIPNRRRFLQGEVLDPMRFINDDPYFDFMYSSDLDSNPNPYYGYSGYIVPSNYPNKTLYNETATGRPDNFGFTSISLGCGYYCEIFRMILQPGAYKIGLFKRTALYSEKYAYITSIPNSTFYVKQNNFTISLNQNTYKKGDTIIASLLSTKFMSSTLYHNRESIFFSVSNRNHGGDYYQWGTFYPDEITNQKLISREVVIDWDEIGTFSFTVSPIGSNTEIVTEFTIIQ